MAQNMNFDTGNNCWYYNDDSSNKKYGRLYNLESALKACPKGWHLPTDKEWKNLAMQFGGYYELETNKDVGVPIVAFNELKIGGNSGFDVLLGGGRMPNGNYDRMGVGCPYWSSTMENRGSSWTYYFLNTIRKIRRGLFPINAGLYCRYIED